MGFDHGVTKESVVSVGTMIEHATRVVDACKGSAGCDEFGEEIYIGFKGVPEHKCVDLEERSKGFSLLEEVEALSLYRVP
jgi:hypothetical protein